MTVRDTRNRRLPRPTRRTALTWALVLACAPASPAQRPSSWARLTLPAPPNLTHFQQLGKVAVHVDGTDAHFFSGWHRRWVHANLLTPQPTAAVFNDIAWVVEPGRVSAFSAYRGVVETLATSPGAVVANTQRNDSILLVVDGPRLHAFPAFTGRFSSRALSSVASPQIAANRHVALLVEGTEVAAMSAFHGTWNAIDVGEPVSSFQGNGSWATVETPSAVFGYSAQRDLWTRTPLPAGGRQMRAGEDCVLYWNGSEAVAYTALRHKFARTPLAGSPNVAVEALHAVVQTGRTLQIFSAVLGQWTTATTSSPVAVRTGPHIATWIDGGRLHAYSPFHGTIATTDVEIAQHATNHGVAAALPRHDGDGPVRLYGSLLGAFVEAPADAAAEVPELVWAGALLRTRTGYAAFSGRSGRCTPLAVSASTIPWTNPDSGILALEDARALHVYEARTERWLSVPRDPTRSLNVAIWRTTLLAIDGTTAHGFGTLAGELESVRLPAPPTHAAANSESLRVFAGNDVFCFGATPDATTLYQYPEFRRVFTAGSDLELRVAGPPLSPALLAVAPKTSHALELPPVGTLFLDPATLVALPVGPLSTEGHATLVAPLREARYLRGRELHLQALVLPPGGVPYLSRLASIGLH